MHYQTALSGTPEKINAALLNDLQMSDHIIIIMMKAAMTLMSHCDQKDGHNNARIESKV